jgi:RNA polymerase sigma factor (sigma-70 family)
MQRMPPNRTRRLSWESSVADNKNSSPTRVKMIDVTRYEPIVKQALKKKRVDPDQCEDMSQECYLALLERKVELSPEAAGKICRTRIQSILSSQRQLKVKKENRIRFVSADDPAISRILSKVAEEQQGPISESELYKAINELEDEYYAIIMLIFVEGLTQPKAAKLLGISRRTLQRKQKNGIMVLRSKFEVKG